VSSCFVGLRKPESGIYRLAVEITHMNPEECAFIDDRGINLECAATLGMQTIEMKTLQLLQADLEKIGVRP
jgi:putative hydrolase of the HAD superfamily